MFVLFCIAVKRTKKVYKPLGKFGSKLSMGVVARNLFGWCRFFTSTHWGFKRQSLCHSERCGESRGCFGPRTHIGEEWARFFYLFSFFHWWKKKQKNLEGIKGIALYAPLAPVAACSLFLQAKNALPLGASLFLKFLRFLFRTGFGSLSRTCFGMVRVSWLVFPVSLLVNSEWLIGQY